MGLLGETPEDWRSRFRSLRLSVRTPPFHGGESGSIPLGSASAFIFILIFLWLLPFFPSCRRRFGLPCSSCVCFEHMDCEFSATFAVRFACVRKRLVRLRFAYFQFVTARRKLMLDLFDRRLKVVEGLERVLGNVFAHAKVFLQTQ